LREELSPAPVRALGIYLGERRALLDDVLVLPATEFLGMLWNGDIIRR
jgi:hypothetical protein